MPNHTDTFLPMVILLQLRHRQVSVAEVRRIVAVELGQVAADTAVWIGENSAGMSYWQWRHGSTPFLLGTCTEPYLNIGGVSRGGRPVEWTIREEPPPDDPNLKEAWDSLKAWLYVDAHGPCRDHLGNVLRIASHFVDETCSLIWLYGGEPKRLLLPMADSASSLRRGEWPA